MSVSQRVVDKAAATGGWIPVPQEMLDATGISEETILSTKQWGKVVPMMRKIGDYVLSTYLANDPRKAMIQKWKERYCDGCNKKRKENMISPVVGFIYMIDSFKNHRGPDEIGRKRNEWRKRLMMQINCKSVWKRTHTALAKIIHNRMNMSESNPGKIAMRVMRAINRQPNVPWSTADYTNLGFPADELLDDETGDAVPIATNQAVTTPAAPRATIDPSGEQILNLVEQKKPEKVNKVDETGNKPPPPQPPATGTVAIPQATTALNAEEDYGAETDDGDDDDDDDDDDDNGPAVGPSAPPSAPVVTADGGYPNDGAPPTQPEPVPAAVPKDDGDAVTATVGVGPDAPPPDPSKSAAETVGLTTTDDSTQVPAEEGDDYDPGMFPAIPDTHWTPDGPVPNKPLVPTPQPLPGIDKRTEEILLNNGNDQPPPPPPEDMGVRVKELDDEIHQLKGVIAEKQINPETLLQERADLKAEISRLNDLVKQQEEESARQKARLDYYTKEKAKWDEKEQMLEAERSKMEANFEDLREQYEQQLASYKTQIEDLEKNIQSLTEAKGQLIAQLDEAVSARQKLSDEMAALDARNTEIAQQVARTRTDDLAEMATLKERSDQLQQQYQDLQTKFNAAEDEVRTKSAELASTRKQLEDAKKAKEEFEQEVNLERDHRSKIEVERAKMDETYSRQINELKTEREQLQTTASNNTTFIAQLRKQIEDRDAQIAELQAARDLVDARALAEQSNVHELELRKQIEILEERNRKNLQTIEKLQKDNAELEARIQELNLTITTLRETMNENTQIINDLRSQLAGRPTTEQLQELQQTLQANHNAAAQALAMATQRAENAEKQRDVLQSQLTTLNEKYTRNLEELEARWKGENATLQATIDELRNRITNLEARLKDAQSAQSNASKQESTLKERIEQNNAKIAELERQLLMSQQQATANLEEIGDLRRRNEFMQTFVNQIKQMANSTEGVDLNAIAGAVKKLLDAAKETDAANSKLATEYKSVQEENAVLNARIVAEQGRLKKLNDVWQALAHLVGNTNPSDVPQGQELAAMIEKIRLELLRGQQAVESLQQRETELHQMEASLSATQASAVNDVKTAQAANQQLIGEKAVLEKQIAALQAANQSLQQDWAKVQKQLDAATAEVEKLKNQIVDAQQEKSGLNKRLQDTETTYGERIRILNEEHTKELAKLNSAIEAYQQTVENNNTRIQELQDLLDEQNLKMQGLTNMLQAQNELNEGQAAELARLQENNQRLVRQLEDLKGENAELMSELGPRAKYARATDGSAVRFRKIPENAPSEAAQEAEMAEGENEADEAAMAEPQVVVSENPPAATANADLDTGAGTVYLTDPATGQPITVNCIELTTKSGTKNRIFLFVRWKNTNYDSPDGFFFLDNNGHVIEEDEFNNYGIPFTSYFELQQRLVKKLIDLRENNQITGTRRFANENRVKVVAQQVASANSDPPPNADSVPAPDVSSDPTVVLLDPANLFPILKAFAEKGPSARYGNVIGKLLIQIKSWIDKMDPRNAITILTDSNYVFPKDRLKEIKTEVLDQYPRLRDQIDAIFTNLTSNLSEVSGANLPAGFKYWLRMFAERWKDGFVVNIDPALMYHTLAALIYERIPSRGLRGFGFGLTNGANSGFVPIPTANNVLPNLYDYYGYGFDPFLKKLHNPPSYFVNDYSGYGYSLYH